MGSGVLNGRRNLEAVEQWVLMESGVFNGVSGVGEFLRVEWKRSEREGRCHGVGDNGEWKSKRTGC